MTNDPWQSPNQPPFPIEPAAPYQPELPYANSYGQPQYGPAQYGQPYFGQPVGIPPQRRRRPRRTVLAIAAGATLVVAALGTTAFAIDQGVGGSGQVAASSYRFGIPYSPAPQGGSSGSSGTQNPYSGGYDQSPYSGGDFGGSPGSSGSTGTTGQATAAQSVGVVDINTTLDYGSAQAAGTGMVLTANGAILTNNHVVDGSTSIKVTVVSTGRTYTAKVVGTDPSDDVAVLQLDNASGLATAKLGDSSSVKVGDSVTGVGNAGGTGGTPSAATGVVTALNQSITASDEGGGNAEQLTGLIETNANIQAGDSGGPLYDAGGKVIGMDTAASSDRSVTTTGYAIPIAKALSIAGQIENGAASSTIHLGYPAFLGVQLGSSGSGFYGGFRGGFGQPSTSGAAITGVVDGSAAAQAGLAAGDTITAVDGTSISDADALATAIASHKPGDKISVGWTDSSGQSHSVTLTLGTGPAG
jgi:S1-C subfamily serine protease